MDNVVVSAKKLTNKAIKRGAHWLGSATALLCLFFVTSRLWEYGSGADLSWLGRNDWVMLVGLAMVYGAANITLAMAWWHLLRHYGMPSTRNWAVRTYGISQIAKYLPGNIFHLAGRQYMGMLAGLDGRALAKSVAAELGLIVVAGMSFFILAWLLIASNLTAIGAMTLFLVILGLTVWILVRRSASLVGSALLYQSTYLAIGGLVFVGTLVVVAPDVPFSPSLVVGCCGAFVCAWLAGFVTPGAPAGAGVREMVLWFLLSGQVNQQDILIAVLFGRMVTVTGDFLFYLAARTLPASGVLPETGISET